MPEADRDLPSSMAPLACGLEGSISAGQIRPRTFVSVTRHSSVASHGAGHWDHEGIDSVAIAVQRVSVEL